jgi:hypothetical protein
MVKMLLNRQALWMMFAKDKLNQSQNDKSSNKMQLLTFLQLRKLKIQMKLLKFTACLSHSIQNSKWLPISLKPHNNMDQLVRGQNNSANCTLFFMIQQASKLSHWDKLRSTSKATLLIKKSQPKKLIYSTIFQSKTNLSRKTNCNLHWSAPSSFRVLKTITISNRII